LKNTNKIEVEPLSSQNNKQKIPLEPQVKPERKSKQLEDCLLCRLTSIQSDRADVVQWLLTTKESKSEKMKIASLLTGLKIDKELLACLEDPSIARIFSSE